MVNSGLLRMLVLTRRPEDIEVSAAESSLDMLRRAAGPEAEGKTVFRPLRVNTRRGRAGLLMRYLQSAWHNVAALCRSRRGDTLIYNFNNVFSIHAINFLSRRLYRGRNIVVVCHGEMEYLANADKHSKAYKHLMARLTKSFFLRSPSKFSPQIHFIVLGDVILSQLGEFLHPEVLARFRSIDHPVTAAAPFDDLSPAAASEGKDTSPLRIGTVGIMNRYKGADTYLRLVERLRGTDVEFSIAGHVQSDLEAFRALGVKMGKDPGEALPDEEFRQMASSLDFILLLYPSDSYRLIASGALLDTIRFRRPLIAISTAYFRYFFEKFGPVGYLAENEDEVAGLIARADTLPREGFDYSGVLSRLSPEALAPDFSKILSECES